MSMMQKKVAIAAIGPSTIRSMALPGTLKIIREYLSDLNLSEVVASSESAFQRNLDVVTDSLISFLPKDSNSWGMARKCVNIFLRDCVYNKYLSDFYKLDPVEKWLEVPLDSHIGKGLILKSDLHNKLRWISVVSLDSVVSERYQKLALEFASNKKVYRVHIDNWLHNGPHLDQS